MQPRCQIEKTPKPRYLRGFDATGNINHRSSIGRSFVILPTTQCHCDLLSNRDGYVGESRCQRFSIAVLSRGSFPKQWLIAHSSTSGAEKIDGRARNWVVSKMTTPQQIS